ncbi:VraH family peptide resistance protein [Staphylococcus canis]|uniref:VraH family protein n=1 Tax=Staphylococcus canis TaxID=2724942 RepID=A0ABS0TBD9_9STAP|nr:VraH family protein [Staphylococcus canis]MBI5976002.1 VraH family protein [Staphylococcus canis]
MSIKQMWKELLNKKWEFEDFLFLGLMIFLASIFTTPLLGVPIGIAMYFWLFYKDEDLDEMAKKYDVKFKNKK